MLNEEADAYDNLAVAIVRQAATDYIRAKLRLEKNPDNNFARGEVQSIIHFFRSEWFYMLTGTNYEWVVEKLDQRAEESKRAKKHKHAVPAKPVAQYDEDGNLVCVYESILEANKRLGISNSSISLCCRGQLKLVGGYRWKFIEKEKE